ncbi:manganese-dependent ADP-ribose CDP-alcohol diphosphatase-like [Raphidocelis subcapitata]|uniref:Manganese-dependent ADP-ribose CDP-alcohol diphosphatase-like n=1 Tax=Raphidocelis subcapitata TaxID=307507 RepID=A0A2V0P226_9CHLO|nr:manganese-dependent ADP-ribose CDP-alcohol diphosphatase-like [Raphidocelis subcapitata]|eukprot:GBF93931.1 manganese-dependent ADP-ribose CDP-alcohol diphosphatase-like [Raphidocelis subcapitata]
MSEVDMLAEVEGAAAAAGTPLLRFGLVADVQYADAEDATSFHGAPRFYRESLNGLSRALDAFASERAAFALNLGDTVDGKQRGAPEPGFDAVMAVFGRSRVPCHHIVGNHDLYNLPHTRLNERLGIPSVGGRDASYYSFVPHPSLRVVMLDSYELSLLDESQGPDHPNRRRAEEIMAVNPNANKHSPDGLTGHQKRFVEFGGGVGDGQLAWLASELRAAASEAQRVVVAGHIPFCPGTAPDPCLLWNFEEVLSLLEGSGVVVATFAGHAHMPGYCLRGGIHHVVMPSILETPPGRDAYAVADLHSDCILLRGRDACMSLALRFAGADGRPVGPPRGAGALTAAAAVAVGCRKAAAAEGEEGAAAGGKPERAAVAVAARA